MQGKWIAGVVVAGAAIGLLIPAGPPKQPVAPTPKPVAIAPPVAADTMTTAPRRTTLYRNSDGHFYADALVDGHSVHFVVDTGASIVALTLADARKMGIPFDRNNFEVVGRGASGDVRGMPITLHHVAIDRQEAFEVPAVILDEGLDVSLLGQSWLRAVDSVQISGETMTLG